MLVIDKENFCMIRLGEIFLEAFIFTRFSYDFS